MVSRFKQSLQLCGCDVVVGLIFAEAIASVPHRQSLEHANVKGLRTIRHRQCCLIGVGFLGHWGGVLAAFGSVCIGTPG
jgi:hypothetical protein